MLTKIRICVLTLFFRLMMRLIVAILVLVAAVVGTDPGTTGGPEEDNPPHMRTPPPTNAPGAEVAVRASPKALSFQLLAADTDTERLAVADEISDRLRIATDPASEDDLLRANDMREWLGLVADLRGANCSSIDLVESQLTAANKTRLAAERSPLAVVNRVLATSESEINRLLWTEDVLAELPGRVECSVETKLRLASWALEKLEQACLDMSDEVTKALYDNRFSPPARLLGILGMSGSRATYSTALEAALAEYAAEGETQEMEVITVLLGRIGALMMDWAMV